MSSLFRHWPVRWRIAGVSAGLTLLILVCVALIVGRLATDRLEGDFENELQDTANRLAIEYGSCPVEEAAHQMRKARRAERACTIAGITASRK